MASRTKELDLSSKYLKVQRERVLFYRCAILYLFIYYIMPPYFGIPNPIFDLTILRIGIIILMLFIIFDHDRLYDFLDTIRYEKMTIVFIPYMIVLLYTMVFRADFNALFNPLIEIFDMYLLIYIIRESVGVDKTIKLVIAFIYLLVLLGFVESFTKVSPFSYMVTLNGLYTGRYVRGGSYRIMSNCGHSLSYGLLLMTALPFAGYDVEKREFNIFRRPFLLIGLIVNVFNTGSRSSLGVMFGEIGLMLILSDRKFLKKNILITIVSVIVFLSVTFCLQSTSIGKFILLQLTSLIDSLFNTRLSVKYGANYSQLMQSKAYRELLKEIFHLSWLNPILGIGRKRGFLSMVKGRKVASIDNFYIAEYVRYAYPGMWSYIFYLGYMGVRIAIDFIKTRSALIRTMLIGAISYCLHLYIADSLMTLKYLYLLFALYICCDKEPYVPEPKGRYHKVRKLIPW